MIKIVTNEFRYIILVTGSLTLILMISVIMYYEIRKMKPFKLQKVLINSKVMAFLNIFIYELGNFDHIIKHWFRCVFALHVFFRWSNKKYVSGIS